MYVSRQRLLVTDYVITSDLRFSLEIELNSKHY